MREASGQWQRKELDREDCPKRLNPNYARAIVTIRATQLSHLGTLQVPPCAPQPKTIRARWSNPTSEKMIAEVRRYALRDMAGHLRAR